ncbi:MAG: sulfite exporter TauE/SafE family protein [Porticoccaceae bacterium]
MELELWQLALLTGAGVIAGWLNVMAGGGSMLTIPIMLFMGFPGPIANGTNRIAILAQNISATTNFRRKGFRELKLGLSLSLAAIPGAIAGAMIGVRLEGELFNRILAIIMIGTMILMMTGGEKKVRQPDHKPTRKQLILGHVCMVGAGFWGGFIQIGVGFILMPILNRVMGLDLVRVNALKVFVILCYTIVALAIFATQVEVLWIAGLALALGNALGGWMGAHSSVTRGDKLIRWVLNSVLVVFIIKLLFF